MQYDSFHKHQYYVYDSIIVRALIKYVVFTQNFQSNYERTIFETLEEKEHWFCRQQEK